MEAAYGVAYKAWRPQRMAGLGGVADDSISAWRGDVMKEWLGMQCNRGNQSACSKM